jgi:hypothetical protein
MKNIFNLIAVFCASSILFSCGSGANSISEVKLIPVKSGNEFQYIDQEGKIVINPQFSEASIFRNDLALVRTTGNERKWGFISEDGKFVITPNYKDATVFSDGLAWVVSENAPPTAINNKGEIKITLQDAERVKIFKEGLAAFSIIDSSGTKWGFVDKSGNIKINPQFVSTGNFSDGKCAVENNDGKWGYIDTDGKIIINYQFEKAKEFINGNAVVVSGNKTGLIDEKGKYLINPQFSDMDIDGSRYLIKQDGKWGWCDAEGKIIINPQFKKAFPFLGNKLAAVQSGQNWGYIDEEGKIIINPQFDGALPYNGKLALVISGRKAGFIDGDGKYVINPQFDDVSEDMVSYMLNGSSKFEDVETDYFNISSIVTRIDANTPEGLSLSSKLSDIVTKLKLTESEFSAYSTEHMIIRNQKITNDASFNFYVIANAFKEVQDGWYSKRVLDIDASVQGYAYAINLSGKGYGKEKEVKEAIEKTFTNYKKDEVQSNDGMNVYKNDMHTVKSYLNGTQIVIVITNNINDMVQNEEVGD